MKIRNREQKIRPTSIHKTNTKIYPIKKMKPEQSNFLKKKTIVVATTSTEESEKNENAAIVAKPTESHNTIFNCTYSCAIKKEPPKKITYCTRAANSATTQLQLSSWH